MTTAAERHTADIIPFPIRGVRGSASHPAGVDQKRQSDMARYADLASGGAWYHEDALKDPTTPKAN